MKKVVIIIFSCILLMGLLDCLPQEKLHKVEEKEISSVAVKEKDVRELVWNQLSTRDKERIKGTWQEAQLKKIALRDYSMGKIGIKSNITGEEVYLVDFQTKDNIEPNNIPVLASIEDYKIIGYAYIE